MSFSRSLKRKNVKSVKKPALPSYSRESQLAIATAAFNQQRDEIVKTTSINVVDNVLTLLFWLLYDKHDFDNEKLKSLYDEFNDLCKFVKNDNKKMELNLRDVRNQLEEETGFKIEYYDELVEKIAKLDRELKQFPKKEK